MAEETPEVVETSEASTPEVTAPPQPRTFSVAGEEYSEEELGQVHQYYQQLEEYAKGLEEFRDATTRLMNPDTDVAVKKRDARQILLDLNYSPEQVDEWVKVYDQTGEQPVAHQESQNQPMYDPRTDQLNQQVTKMRAQMIQQNMENSVSSSLSGDADGKVLLDWIKNNRSEQEFAAAKENIAERVRSQALENLRNRKNYAGSFDETWVAEEVQKATSKVAKDMLTVIGDTSKIGRVPETAGQTETLYRKDPVKLPDTKGKSFGDVEGQLRNWTTDQILRSLSNPGGDSKA